MVHAVLPVTPVVSVVTTLAAFVAVRVTVTAAVVAKPAVVPETMTGADTPFAPTGTENVTVGGTGSVTVTASTGVRVVLPLSSVASAVNE